MENALDIKSIRKTLNMTQADLAAEVGVDQSTVSNWENGQAPRGPAKILLTGLAEKASQAAVEAAE